MKEEVIRTNGKYLEFKENEKNNISKFINVAKAGLRGKCIALNV